MTALSTAVLEWARTKPAGEAYDYMDGWNCALGQFLRETGRAEAPFVTDYGYLDGRSDWQMLPTQLADELERGAHTFGGLAERLADEMVLA